MDKPQRRPVRFVTFRVGAVLLGLSLLILVEVVVRLFFAPAGGIELEDPYVSFEGTRPLFVPAASGERFETSSERLTFFQRDSFSAVKDAHTRRVFCLGGSTVQGRPYSIETSFTSWLELSLQAADPETDWEVVNCGGISYASYRLVPLMREMLEYAPDLFVIYTGHNEFLEDRTYGRIKKMPSVLKKVHRIMLKLQTYRLISTRRRQSFSRSVLPVEVQAKLDYEQGLESYRRDDVWRNATIEHFRFNMESMVRMSLAADVPIILVNPVSNIRDCPPFKSEFSQALPEREVENVVELWEQASTLDWAHVGEKVNLLEQALAIEGRHAGLLYSAGKCYERMGRWAEAKERFMAAKEQDVCPLRILGPMREAIRELAGRYKVPLVDAEMIIEEQTDNAIAGNLWLLDHVHPTISGHQLIAKALHDEMVALKLVKSDGDFEVRRRELWRRHLSSLDDIYYARGASRMKRLKEWSSGRIPNPPSK
jgi:hypothetical protein